MQILLRCCRCDYIGETDTDLLCPRCGQTGWRPEYEPLPPITGKELRSMAKLLAVGTDEDPGRTVREVQRAVPVGRPAWLIQRAVSLAMRKNHQRSKR